MAKVLEIQPAKEKPYRRATALTEAGEIDEAFDVLDGILKEDPNDPQALAIMAEVLKKAKKLPMAYAVAQRAAALKPERPEVWATLGHCAQQLWRLDEALSCYRKAKQRAQTKKQLALYLNNIGSVHLDGGEFAKAEPHVLEALKLVPDDMQARHNLGLCYLGQRRWREGWINYSASIGSGVRLNTKYLAEPEPTWDGTPDKTVVIYGEQGLGDEICAASMVPDAMRDCKRVILDCDARLAPLFRRSFGCTVHGTRTAKDLNWPAEDQAIDASISSFEIGKFYRNDDKDFPGTPYLTPCPDRTFMWKALRISKRKPMIGIAWSGGTFHNAGMFRKLPLSDWRPIFDAVDAHWVSLQYKDASADIAGTPVVQYAHATLTKDYDDTAALVAACDLVICVQTSIGHLAGALGVPAWVMVPHTSQWRYGESYRDIPWYSSVKLYRQVTEWPVGEIVADLRRMFANH
jgi:tetratricopeptide (TPR) repeat protein